MLNVHQTSHHPPRPFPTPNSPSGLRKTFAAASSRRAFGRTLLAAVPLETLPNETAAAASASTDAAASTDADGTTPVPPNATATARNCTPAAIHEFPPDGFRRSQRQRGWIVLHVVLACYCFWLLAIVCDDYFVPAMESLCSSECNQTDGLVQVTHACVLTESLLQLSA